MKELIIHVSHNDSDGVGCTILSKYYAIKHNMEVVYYNVSYGEIESAVHEALQKLEQNADRVKYFIITDLSIRPESNVGKSVDAAYKKYYNTTFALLDHHPGTYWANKYDWALVQESDECGVKHCGTFLLYKFYKQQLNYYTRQYNSDRLLCKFVKYTDLYDTWAWKTYLPGDKPLDAANDLNTLLLIKGIQKHMSDMLYNLTHLTDDIFSPEDLAMIKSDSLRLQNYVEVKSKQIIRAKYNYRIEHKSHLDTVQKYFHNLYASDPKSYEKAMKNFKMDYVKRFKIGIVYADSNISELGNTLAELNPELDFICIIDMPGKIHFRSAKDLDVPLGLVAMAIGKGVGGGHARAAAANISPRNSTEVIDTLIYN